MHIFKDKQKHFGMLIISLFLFTINGDMYDELVRMWKH